MRGDTRFYSSPGITVFCGHCDRYECGHHYKNKDKYPWRYYKGYSTNYNTTALSDYKGCCKYESPSETKEMVKKHLKRVKIEKEIEIYRRRIAELEALL